MKRHPKVAFEINLMLFRIDTFAIQNFRILKINIIYFPSKDVQKKLILVFRHFKVMATFITTWLNVTKNIAIGAACVR